MDCCLGPMDGRFNSPPPRPPLPPRPPPPPREEDGAPLLLLFGFGSTMETRFLVLLSAILIID